MKISLGLVRVFFLLISIVVSTAYIIRVMPAHPLFATVSGIVLGSGLGSVLIAFDTLLRRYNLRSLNTVILGTFIGYLLGSTLELIFSAVINFSAIDAISLPMTAIKTALLLFGIYLGLIMTVRAAEEINVAIPFVTLKSLQTHRHHIIVDSSMLMDPRIVDVAASGIVNKQLRIPTFVIRELQHLCEIGDEPSKERARRSLDIVSKLGESPTLQIYYDDTSFPEINSPLDKLIKLAQLNDASVLTADNSRAQSMSAKGITIINIHTLSNALKPVMQAGEMVSIKIQRYGKEPLQGVGYLDDGTMVVVNSGGNFIGETIRAQVLSVKQTASGRMIFCNVIEETNIPFKTYSI